MSYVGSSDWALDVSKGLVPGHVVNVKFGYNESVGTTFVPISAGGIYRTPQVSAATQLRVKAGDANDTAAGSGARSVFIQGLNALGEEVSETLVTAGTSASANSTNSYIRLYRAFVASSGTYVSQSAGSHAADIVIENAAGTEDWLTIRATSFPRGQSTVGVYTVPLGYTAYLMGAVVDSSASKAVDVLVYQRANILETAAPYTAMRLVREFANIEGTVDLTIATPVKVPQLTDFGLMAKVASGTTTVGVALQLILVENET